VKSASAFWALTVANAPPRRKLDEYRAERDAAQERKTATAEISQVIRRSPGDLAPVYDAMLERAMLWIPMMSATCSDRSWPADPIDVRRGGGALDGSDLSMTGCIGSSSAGLGRPLLAQTVAAEQQAVSVMDEPVEDGIGEGRLTDQVAPAVDRDL